MEEEIKTEDRGQEENYEPLSQFRQDRDILTQD